MIIIVIPPIISISAAKLDVMLKFIAKLEMLTLTTFVEFSEPLFNSINEDHRP